MLGHCRGPLAAAFPHPSAPNLRRTRAFIPFPPAAPRNVALALEIKPVSSDSHQLTPKRQGSTRPSRPRLGFGHRPLIRDREALRASAHSLCRRLLLSLIIGYFSSLLPSQYHTDPNTKSEAVALKRIELSPNYHPITATLRSILPFLSYALVHAESLF